MRHFKEIRHQEKIFSSIFTVIVLSSSKNTFSFHIVKLMSFKTPLGRERKRQIGYRLLFVCRPLSVHLGDL